MASERGAAHSAAVVGADGVAAFRGGDWRPVLASTFEPSAPPWSRDAVDFAGPGAAGVVGRLMRWVSSNACHSTKVAPINAMARRNLARATAVRRRIPV